MFNCIIYSQKNDFNLKNNSSQYRKIINEIKDENQ